MNKLALTNAAIAYADRYDIEVNENINNFYLFTEARINRLLKTRRQSARAFTLTIENREYYSLPPDWSGMRDIQVTNPTPLIVGAGTISLRLIDPALLNQYKLEESRGQRNTNGFPTYYYCVIADQIQIFPILANGLSIEMIYYQQVPSLALPAIDTSSNWLSENNPDIYLSGLCAEISLFAKDYDAASSWYSRLEVSISELDSSDQLERWSGDPLQVRLG
tara:strand:+ start:927 stop:1589 length:663 start_codon:yes stop_codon:yes gene_type:complete